MSWFSFFEVDSRGSLRAYAEHAKDIRVFQSLKSITCFKGSLNRQRCLPAELSSLPTSFRALFITPIELKKSVIDEKNLSNRRLYAARD